MPSLEILLMRRRSSGLTMHLFDLNCLLGLGFCGQARNRPSFTERGTIQAVELITGAWHNQVWI